MKEKKLKVLHDVYRTGTRELHIVCSEEDFKAIRACLGAGRRQMLETVTDPEIREHYEVVDKVISKVDAAENKAKRYA